MEALWQWTITTSIAFTIIITLGMYVNNYESHKLQGLGCISLPTTNYNPQYYYRFNDNWICPYYYNNQR